VQNSYADRGPPNSIKFKRNNTHIFLTHLCIIKFQIYNVILINLVVNLKIKCVRGAIILFSKIQTSSRLDLGCQKKIGEYKMTICFGTKSIIE